MNKLGIYLLFNVKLDGVLLLTIRLSPVERQLKFEVQLTNTCLFLEKVEEWAKFPARCSQVGCYERQYFHIFSSEPAFPHTARFSKLVFLSHPYW